jgi:hypothetical protein
MQKYDFFSFLDPANGQQFLMLPKVDPVLESETGIETRMLHTKTALSACYVIARNTLGFFAVEKERARAVRIDVEFLAVDEVFYHLEDPTAATSYPICTKFKNWGFPHDAPLNDWRAVISGSMPNVRPIGQSSVSEAVKQRDGKCRTTGYTAMLQHCHLIPKSERKWVCPIF